MLSFYEKLEGFCRSNVLTYKTLSRILIDCFKEGVFISQQELANRANTSKSLTTVFAKDVGTSGYRELIILLKMEREKFFPTPNNETKKFSFFESTISHLMKNYGFCIDLAQAIYDAKIINLYASNQSISSVEYFRDSLFTLGKNVNVVWNSNLISRIDNNPDLEIIFYMGRDNFTMKMYKIENGFHPNTFAIISDTQSQLFDLPPERLMTINHEYDVPTDSKRAVFLHMFLFHICQLVNSEI